MFMMSATMSKASPPGAPSLVRLICSQPWQFGLMEVRNLPQQVNIDSLMWYNLRNLTYRSNPIITRSFQSHVHRSQRQLESSAITEMS
jgi:hypothetical protein